MTPAQKRAAVQAAEREFDRIARDFLRGYPQLPPPLVWVTFEAWPLIEVEFQFTGENRKPKANEWALQGHPPIMAQWKQGPKGSRFPIYVQTGRTRLKTRQNEPPPPPPPRSTPDAVSAAYAALGLQPGASQTEIRAAFAAIARRDHPDINPGDAAAEARMKEAAAAYTLLKTRG